MPNDINTLDRDLDTGSEGFFEKTKKAELSDAPSAQISDLGIPDPLSAPDDSDNPFAIAAEALLVENDPDIAVLRAAWIATQEISQDHCFSFLYWLQEHWPGVIKIKDPR